MFSVPAAPRPDAENSELPERDARPSRDLQKLWEGNSPRLLKAGQHVFRAGDAQLDLYEVVSGTIRLYRNLKDGRRQVIGFLFTGDLIGVELQSQHFYSAQAIGAASLRSVPVTTVRELAFEQPRLLFELHATLARETAAAQDLMLAIGRADPEERLARFLVALARRNPQPGRDPVAIVLSMPRRDIADHLGLTIETVSRTLTKLVKQRLIKLSRRRSIQILDPDALEALMEGLPRVARRRRGRR
jgi:CRP/FNR family transcriptional regulator, anaerobic regulatory protein